ncbi:hypothetical protein M1L60_25550 [Actinoplanes sp. TRM 88003]|uniref:Glycosyltransferase RgtA/B/C/D-like domain-containing protein n=1 Tax=Paractinoplanes aksuensis TaxID=2939490 RepID=A0ABT1DSZ0_9ACTN|nr:hypothetical protein [Actinoplanes aksuensis]MCO8273969.1 hypothetical protein [Actinoplanes aksuensis]
MSAATAPAVRTARIDPVDAVAGVLILLSVLWRAVVARRGFLAIDDFPIVSQADAYGWDLEHLFGLYNNHFMPLGRITSLIVERFAGYDYTPLLVLMLLAQAAVGVAFYRLLKLMLPAGWALLLPLCLLVFNPLTLEITAWWAVGVNLLPMQFAMIMAVGAMVKYLRTGDRHHLISLAAAVLVGLLFFEKVLFAVPLVFLVALCLYAPGGPVRAVVTTVRRWWPAWALLTVIVLVYLGAYLARSTASTVREPSSAGEVGTFFGQYFGETLAPGLIGGPWSWLAAGDGTAVVAPTDAARWISWILLAALVTGTIWWRRWVAVRAWTLLLIFALLAGGLIAATRLGSALSGVAGLVPRYLGDVMPVAALCVGIAICGLRKLDDTADAANPPAASPSATTAPRRPGAITASRLSVATVAAAALFVASSAWSSVDFSSDWSGKAGRDYLRTAQADLAVAGAGTVFMDQPVPEEVVPSMSSPWNMQSRFFGPVENGPTFVTEAQRLSIFDQSGHVRPAWVDGVRAEPGPVKGCGYQVTRGRTVTIPLESAVVDYWQVLRIGYLSDKDTTATVQSGDRPARSFAVRRGLNAMFILMLAGGDKVTLKADDPAANICTDEIEIGPLVPQPAG